ncbi:SNF2 family N-terminal domain-containing protein [Hysterangium stoloniferum]|nr:SNF2 family N-terminal domain-containing protein [Hysterangium stoloniferum]
MSACASLIYISGIDPPDLPFQINVTVSISLLLPNIFEPRVIHPPPKSCAADYRRRLLTYIFNPPSEDAHMKETADEIAIRKFYATLKPACPITSSVISAALQPKDLLADLLPFQRRSVKWLLERESKTIDDAGSIVPISGRLDDLPLFWEKIKPPPFISVKGKTVALPSEDNWWYFNRITGALVSEKPPNTEVAGAMLCEEMGLGNVINSLGKTLECIALILLSPANDRDPRTTRWDLQTEIYISDVKTNLIVTPLTLSQQWLDELKRHAPSLNVLFYNGYSKVKLPKLNVREADNLIAGSESHHNWSTFLHEFDVVVTTYKTLQDELGVAKAPVIRPKRQAASYSHVEKPRSPLVRVEWARVFMDEVQLVGGGKTAEMVSLIPRKASIAVSGTPAKSKVSDLSHVLRFLGVHEAIGRSRTWERLLQPQYHDLFVDIFRKYAIRTLKSSVKDELTIPLQKRYAVGIELGRVEKHIYDQTLQDALDELGVDARGVTISGGWEIDTNLLRTWLRKLRQICTHPQVGNLQRKANKATTIKTMQEVLQDLQTKNWQSLIVDWRSKINSLVRRAQLSQKVEEDFNRYDTAHDLLVRAQTETENLLADIRRAITEHEAYGKILKEETAALRRQRGIEDGEGTPLANDKGKGRARSVDPFSDIDSDDEEDGLPRTRLGSEYRTRKRNLQARLREAYVLQHKVMFFLGDVFHVLEQARSEDKAYGEAENIRKSLLKTTSDAATASMRQLSQTSRDITGLHKKNLEVPHCSNGGIHSAGIIEEANDILDLLNDQAELIWSWRDHIFTLLTQKLSGPEGNQADGEEYGRSLDTQGEVEAYLQAYASLIADRKEALIAERTALATHDAKDVHERRTLTAKKAQITEAGDNFDDYNDDDIPDIPKDTVLQNKLGDVRKELRAKHGTRAVKTMMILLSEIGNRAGTRSEENQIAKDEGKRLRNVITDQGNFMEKLELEMAQFRKVFNDRIQYFKQLQELSDTVREAEWDGNVRVAIEVSKAEEDALVTTINRKRAQGRHLRTIAKDQEEGDLEEDCVLCRSDFSVGLITPCAHIFCERCLVEWMKANHYDCPVCRTKFKSNALQRISLDDDALQQIHKERKNKGVPMKPDRKIQFNSLPPHVLDEIQTFESHGSYGSKIMHLVRHLLCLQHHEPGTKSVVFSAWSDSLAIIEQALTANGIASIKADQKGKQNAAQRFKTDPGIIVFLLHGERENAGLNLTCAKRVWLIEPTVNHSFEVQAISRVDRMGQTAATEVFCYYIQVDTVEENILRMGAKHGFSLYTRDCAEDVMDISQYSMGNHNTHIDSPSKKKSKQKGDFVEKAEDLLHVLFPHLDYNEDDFESFVNPDRADGMAVDGDQYLMGSPTSRLFQGPVAGPSRLQ